MKSINISDDTIREMVELILYKYKLYIDKNSRDKKERDEFYMIETETDYEFHHIKYTLKNACIFPKIKDYKAIMIPKKEDTDIEEYVKVCINKEIISRISKGCKVTCNRKI